MSPAPAAFLPDCVTPVTLPQLLDLVENAGWDWLPADPRHPREQRLAAPDRRHTYRLQASPGQILLRPILDVASLALPPGDQ
jgi:hypothetical protein